MWPFSEYLLPKSFSPSKTVQPGPSIIEDVVPVAASDVRAAIWKSAFRRLRPYFWDATISVPTMDTWRRIIAFNVANEPGYIAERRDCDDYAKYFAACCAMNWGVNACGLVIDYSGGHAYNALLYRDATDQSAHYLHVVGFEPQNDRFITPGQKSPDGAMYAARQGFIQF